MRKYIRTTPREKKRLAGLYKRSRQTIAKYLQYYQFTSLKSEREAEIIRRDALEHGGVLVEEKEVTI